VIWTVAPAHAAVARPGERLPSGWTMQSRPSAKSASPKFLPDRAPKVIVWLALAMENDCGTSVAGFVVCRRRLATPSPYKTPCSREMDRRNQLPNKWPVAENVVVRLDDCSRADRENPHRQSSYPASHAERDRLARLGDGERLAGHRLPGCSYRRPLVTLSLCTSPPPVMWTVVPATLQLPVRGERHGQGWTTQFRSLRRSASPNVFPESAPKSNGLGGFGNGERLRYVDSRIVVKRHPLATR